MAPEVWHTLTASVSALVWDQAERDVKCPRSLAHYACMEKFLINSWRQVFRSPKLSFVGVQLAGYTGPIISPDREHRSMISAEMVFQMRLKQEQGCEGVAGGSCSVVPTYDMSCSAGLAGGCPFGSVHQPHKATIGARVGQHLLRSGVAGSAAAARVADGPRVTGIKVVSIAAAAAAVGLVRLVASFSGGSMPFALKATRNCTSCCDAARGNGHTLDLDASADGVVFFNATNVQMVPGVAAVSFDVAMSKPPMVVRHTAASIWPQCALYNAEGMPLFPFVWNVSSTHSTR